MTQSPHSYRKGLDYEAPKTQQHHPWPWVWATEGWAGPHPSCQGLLPATSVRLAAFSLRDKGDRGTERIAALS